MKKTLTYILATAILLIGLISIAPLTSAGGYYIPATGDLIKTTTNPTVYYIGTDNNRHLYPNQATFWTWHTGSWSNLKSDGITKTVKIISQPDFDRLNSGNNVTVRPLNTLLRFQNSTRMYIVTTDNKLALVTDAIAPSIFGNNWNQRVITIQDGFESDYTKDGVLNINAGWSCSDWSTCTNSQQTKTWTKIRTCSGGVSHNATETVSCNPQIPTCTSFSYSAWSACLNSQQTRTVSSALPVNCTGGSPVLAQSCSTPIFSITVPSANQQVPRQTHMNIAWDKTKITGNYVLITFMKGGVKYILTPSIYSTPGIGIYASKLANNGSYTSSPLPNNLPLANDYSIQITNVATDGVTPGNITINSANFSIVASGTNTCTSFSYSDWTPAICPSSGIQTRTVSSALPVNCTGGSPVLAQSCNPPVTLTCPSYAENVQNQCQLKTLPSSQLPSSGFGVVIYRFYSYTQGTTPFYLIPTGQSIKDGTDLDNTLSLIKNSGAKWVRIDFGQNAIEKIVNGHYNGEYDWSYTDYIVDSLKQNGVSAEAMMIDFPTRYPYSSSVPGAAPIYSDAGLAEWLNFVRAAGERYGDYIKYWEVWNEPNIPSYWRPAPSYRDYSALVRATVPVIRAVVPGAKIVAGNTAGVDLAYIQELVSSSANMIDIIGFHPYNSLGVPELVYGGSIYRDRIAAAKAMLAGTSIVLWDTEIGYLSVPSLISTVVHPPISQTQYLLRQYLLDLGFGIEHTNWFHLGCPRYGNSFCLADYTDNQSGRAMDVKPAYYALQRLASLVGGSRATGETATFSNLVSSATTGASPKYEDIYSFILSSNGRTMIPYWLGVISDTSAKTAQVTMTIPLHLTNPKQVDLSTGVVSDISGVSYTSNGTVISNLTISDSPYVIVD